MKQRSLRLPTGLLIVVAILGAMLVVTDIDQVVEAGNWAPLRSDLRSGLIIIAIGALLWLDRTRRFEAADELPSGYAEGYADGLSRSRINGKSMDGKVVHFDRT